VKPSTSTNVIAKSGISARGIAPQARSIATICRSEGGRP
jgi:hypothetical protein